MVADSVLSIQLLMVTSILIGVHLSQDVVLIWLEIVDMVWLTISMLLPSILPIISVQRGLFLTFFCQSVSNTRSYKITDVAVFKLFEIEIALRLVQVLVWVVTHQITVVLFQVVLYFGYLQLAPIHSLRDLDNLCIIWQSLLKFLWFSNAKKYFI